MFFKTIGIVPEQINLTLKDGWLLLSFCNGPLKHVFCVFVIKNKARENICIFGVPSNVINITALYSKIVVSLNICYLLVFLPLLDARSVKILLLKLVQICLPRVGKSKNLHH